MGYRTLTACLDDLEKAGHLVRIEQEIDPHLEAAAIQRRVSAAGGPAIYYARVKGCRFPMVSNLFGGLDRLRFMFRDTLAAVERLVELKIDPSVALARPWKYASAFGSALRMPPRTVRRGAVAENETTIDQLPQVTSWPDDGGPFITLPQVYTEHPDRPGWKQANLGMYRIQLAGNQYQLNRQVGLHYQIHRGIGVHHAAAIRRGEPLRVVVTIGGPPALAVAAVMPLPEGLPELTFAGALGGRSVPLLPQPVGPPVCAEADFAIVGYVEPGENLPEGPFGDHLGYYAKVHDFPVLNVERVLHRTGAVWPFTVVGRPPQEDTTFGKFIHELTGSVIPSVLPGVKAVHAVDAAGVHPLLLAIGSERYTPYAKPDFPQELLTQANAILGQGQMSLAKYLWIAAEGDDPTLDLHDIPRFFAHVLRRVDWTRDLHFQTRTTIDTLDYSGTGLNQGSKLVIAAVGPSRRELASELSGVPSLPDGFDRVHLAMPGIAVLSGPPHQGASDEAVARLCRHLEGAGGFEGFPLLVMVDDSEFAARTLNNFLWVTFTRSNPAADMHGVNAFVEEKHWGCRGPLVIDARSKPHHAPPLVEDPEITRRVDALGAAGGPLAGII